MKKLQDSLKYSSTINPLKIVRKRFLFSNNNPGQEISIFKCCETLLSQIKRNDYTYNTDVLIFTSQTLIIGQEFPGDNIKNKKYSWGQSFKWKPPEYNTIDFLVKVKKDNKNELNVKSKLINGEIHQFYELELMVGFDEKRHGNKQMTLLRLDHEKPDYFKSSNKYHPEKFYPTGPSDENAHICHVPLKPDAHGALNMYTIEKDIMMDDTIVEFSYDMNAKDKFMKWIPLRVRFDKTSEYKNFGNNFGNAYHVANSNWQSIHDPITEEMLSDMTKIENMVIQENDEDVYYNGSKVISQTKALRAFHNKYVKKMLIEQVARISQTYWTLLLEKEEI